LRVNNGNVTNGNTVVDFGGLAKGAGFYSSITTVNGGRFSPGNSPGRATVGSFTLGPDGADDFEIADAAGGWDLTNVADRLDVTATPAEPFTFRVVSLLDGSTDVPGAMANFDATRSYSWLAFDVAALGTVHFDPAAIVVDASRVENAFTGGFALVQGAGADANRIYLTYDPAAVPEPASPLLLACAATAASLLARRRRMTP
jgi:hypothetical protein